MYIISWSFDNFSVRYFIWRGINLTFDHIKELFISAPLRFFFWLRRVENVHIHYLYHSFTSPSMSVIMQSSVFVNGFLCKFSPDNLICPHLLCPSLNLYVSAASWIFHCVAELMKSNSGKGKWLYPTKVAPEVKHANIVWDKPPKAICVGRPISYMAVIIIYFCSLVLLWDWDNIIFWFLHLKTRLSWLVWKLTKECWNGCHNVKKVYGTSLNLPTTIISKYFIAKLQRSFKFGLRSSFVTPDLVNMVELAKEDNF